MPRLLANQSRAFQLLSRKCPKNSPWNSLEPERVVTAAPEPGRSPDSGANAEVRSSTDCVVSGDPRFSVVPMAVIAGSEAPGNDPGKELPPAPVLALTPSTRKVLALGRCPLEVNWPASL